LFTQHISRTERVIIVAAVKMTACTHQTRGCVKNKNMSFYMPKFEVPLCSLKTVTQTIRGCSETNQDSRSSESRPLPRVLIVVLAAIKKGCNVPNNRAQET
jgi:hypothetical protein